VSLLTLRILNPLSLSWGYLYIMSVLFIYLCGLGVEWLKMGSEEKKRVLAKYLGCEAEDIAEGYEWYGEYMTYELGDQEYLVLTDEEADEAVRLAIRETVWAFEAWFIIDHSALPYSAVELIESFQAHQCEDANEAILAVITDFDRFVKDAVCADGRGHFLSGYDGEEVEAGDYLIYRLN